MPIEKNLKPNFFDKFKLYSETTKPNNNEIITIKSLLRRPTGMCAVSAEKHKDPVTNKTTMLVEKIFDRSTGNMTEQTSMDYNSGSLTTEIWSPLNGAQNPEKIIEEDFSSISSLPPLVTNR